MRDTSYLNWPFFERAPPRARRQARRVGGSRISKASIITMSMPPAASSSPLLGRDGWLQGHRAGRGRRGQNRRAHAGAGPRNAGAPFGARRFRLRDAGPRRRTDLAVRHAGATRRLAAEDPQRQGDCRFRADRSGFGLRCRQYRDGGTARRQRLCHRRREDAGSRTAASPISMSCSPAPARRRARAGCPPSSSKASNPGLTIAERIDVIAPHPLARLAFKGCRVPAAALIGQSGDGFKIAMATLDVFRTTVGAAALGFARRAMSETIKRAKSRKMLGAPLADLQMVQGHIADMALEIDAAALLVYRAAWAKDMGAARIRAKPRWPSSMPPKPRSASSTRPCRFTAATACGPAIRSKPFIGKSGPCASTKARQMCRKSLLPGQSLSSGEH